MTLVELQYTAMAIAMDFGEEDKVEKIWTNKKALVCYIENSCKC
jgi:hypothetical protein